ncbi:MAG TPA: hypothetical protein VGH19_07560 [Verrucomicrobiae bacterium]
MDASSNQLALIQQELRSGNKIGAVKLYREWTGVGLAEAKEAVERIEAGKPLDVPRSASTTDIPTTIVPERVAWIQEALFQNNKVKAIKLYREGANCQLKEAKEAIDRYEANLRTTSPEKFAAKPSVFVKLLRMLRA